MGKIIWIHLIQWKYGFLGQGLFDHLDKENGIAVPKREEWKQLFDPLDR